MTFHKFIVLLLILSAFLVGRNAIARLVGKIGAERHIAPARIQYVKASINIVWALLALAAAGVVAGVGYHELGVFFGSVVAIFGIALIAQWSILSNVTASVIVFFFFPYRVGHYVRIVDGENTVEGVIREITLFHVILEDDDMIVTYPNTLVFQRAVKISPTGKPHERQAAPPQTEQE